MGCAGVMWPKYPESKLKMCRGEMFVFVAPNMPRQEVVNPLLLGKS